MSTFNTNTVNDLTVHKFPDIATYTTNSSSVASTDIVEIDPSALQEKLVSGTNIKTVNGTSILGSGNISVSGGGTGGDISFATSGSTQRTYVIQNKSETFNLSVSAYNELEHYILVVNTGEDDFGIWSGTATYYNGASDTVGTQCGMYFPESEITVKSGCAVEISYKFINNICVITASENLIYVEAKGDGN